MEGGNLLVLYLDFVQNLIKDDLVIFELLKTRILVHSTFG